MTRLYIDKTKLSKDFLEATNIKDESARYLYYKAVKLTGSVSFPKLTSIGSSGLYQCFRGCTGLTSISFPELTTIDSDGLYGCFYGCTNLTEVHFPKALEGNSECTTDNMRCANATVYFDL